ncbi:DUF935 family protein [Sphingomonas cannabina]|uniref:phage portal protein family protein n=1 Tax=Sphingomonas cannabina TaxID=2899123 RepID=UPI001F2EB15A|nr:DUF935 family protein [Sphingomonas cannabina]UIJ46935.1 DUF935 family protein [Sphingomonas cannabina]
MAQAPRSWGGWMQRGGIARVPADLAGEIATTRDGRDITRPWISELEESPDPRITNAIDWGLYDRVLLDDQVKSCMEQRIRGVVAREWNVVPGDDQDPRSVAAADGLKKAIERVGWDRITEKKLYAVLFGYSVAELMWAPIDGQLAWSKIRVRHARRFRYDKDGRLRLLTRANMRGEILPDRKFWVTTSGGTDDDTTYGRGLAEWLYFPVLFKRNGVRFWNIFLDKFSVPTAKGTYPRGASRDDQMKLLAAVQAIATDSGFVVPEGMEVELLELAKNGADFGAACRYMDGAIAKIILSQTMTTDAGAAGLGSNQANVHEGVKDEVVIADADLLTDSFTGDAETGGPARWYTDFNFGTDVAAPRVVRVAEEEIDLKVSAETDEAISRLGWTRTEESFRDVYGDGYERKEQADTPPAPPAAPAVVEKPGTADDNRVDPTVAGAVAFAASDPKTLYVYRRLLNTADVVEWARGQGFASMVPPTDLHVTVAYSRRPVNWFEMAQEYGAEPKLEIPAGGPRVVDRLGERAIVLHFASNNLCWRNREMRDKGASWDYLEYYPHITLTYAGDDLDLAAIEPYRGELVFGPEIFEPLDEGWNDKLIEVSFAEPAAPRDVIDEAVDTIMADEGWRELIGPIVDPLVEQLQAATSRDDVIAILAREAELAGDQALIESLARAGFAARIDALTDSSEER